MTNRDPSAAPAPGPKLYDARRRPLVKRQTVERRYHISSRTLDNWMKQRKIPFIKVGRLLFFCVEDVDQALQRFEVKAK